MVMPNGLSLPEEPLLNQAAKAMRDAQQWGMIYDSHYRLMWASDATIRDIGDQNRISDLLGRHALNFYPEPQLQDHYRLNTDAYQKLGEMILADTPGGVEELRELTNPSIRHIIDEMIPSHTDFECYEIGSTHLYGTPVKIQCMFMRIRDDAGHVVGAAEIVKPAGDAYTLAEMTAILNPRAMVQMHAAARASRRPAAILCADLEGSAQLSRRLSTETYFRLTRRLVFSADHCVVQAGGLVGRHAGDGVTAFFLAENLGSDAAAARACLESARALRAAAADVAVRSDVEPGDLVLRFGLHWGSTLYVGAITTEGRFEVTAMGDEVNEAARIEACATGGLTLASKDLIERLTPDDALELGLNPSRMKYTPLAGLASATEKARRDAPSLAVCAI